MANDSEPVGDLQPVGPTRVPDGPTENRLDYGDEAQRAELDGVAEDPVDEPMEMVDAPIRVHRPVSRAEKQRNQRR